MYEGNISNEEKSFLNEIMPLEKYIDKEYVDYEAFEEGKQVVLFLRNLPDGGYDDTIHAGDTLYYNYYQVSTDTYEKFANKSYYYYFPYEEAFAKAKNDVRGSVFFVHIFTYFITII